MNYIVSFLPWLVFAVVSTQADWQVSGLVGLVIAVVLLVVRRSRGTAWEALVIELSAVLFFVVVTAFAFAAPASPVRDYVGALVDLWLAVTAWGSLALGRPFTLGIAKTVTEPEIWHLPVFRRVNVVITTVWALSFTVAGLVETALLAAAPHATAALVVCKVLGFAVPIVFTIRYPAVARARAEKAA